MSRLGSAFFALVAFAAINTAFAVTELAGLLSSNTLGIPQGAVGIEGVSSQSLSAFLIVPLQFLSVHSLELAPTSWVLAGGVWMWRGHMKARWEGLGFDSDVFRLFMKMKGGKTRLKLLNALSIPKDRYQLAKELGLDWRAVDQHLVVLSKHSLVAEENAYGKVKMYSLTSAGKSMLRLLEDLDHVANGEGLTAHSTINERTS